MSIASDNAFVTNELATAVAVRAAENMSFALVGSSKYFAGQITGKNNGQKYKFYVRDTGDAVNRLAYQDGDKVTLVERAVELSLEPWHVMIKTNAIEGVTDVENWADEIARPNSVKLAQGMVKKVINENIGKAATAFIGSGFTPLSQASAHVASVANGDIYGFCAPQIEAILTSNGQQFVPVNAPDMYSKGLLGRFHGAEYRAQRFFPTVVISEAASTALNSAIVSNAAVDSEDSTKWNLTLSGASVSGISISRGTPLFIEGVVACDIVGDPTDAEQVFVVLEGVNATADTVVVKVEAKDIKKGGTREVCAEDGTSFSAVSVLADKAIKAPEAGKYYIAQLRVDGAMEFETLDKLDAAGAQYQKSPEVDGLTIHQNRLVDLKAMTDDTRWDVVTLAGIVEPRGVALAYIK